MGRKTTGYMRLVYSPGLLIRPAYGRPRPFFAPDRAFLSRVVQWAFRAAAGLLATASLESGRQLVDASLSLALFCSSIDVSAQRRALTVNL